MKGDLYIKTNAEGNPSKKSHENLWNFPCSCVLYNMRYFPYNKKLKNYSREHRNESTYAEVLLWLELRNRQFRGYKFNRQKPLGNYIADFYCAQLKLVIEVDGITHINGEQQERDKEKDRYFRSKKITVLRLDDEEVRKNISAALEEIEDYIDDFECKLKNE